jgi:hypothetical protein
MLGISRHLKKEHLLSMDTKRFRFPAPVVGTLLFPHPQKLTILQGYA